jgi:hypothetical protein
VNVLTSEDLERARSLSAVDALQRRHMTLLPCFSTRGRDYCIRRRMETISPLVCVDEQELPGGVGELRNFPAAIFHTIEVHDGGALVRGYTKDFVSRLQSGQIRLMPTFLRNRC